MIAAAQRVILVIDSSKFKKTGFYRVCDLAQINLVLTDRGLSPAASELMDTKNIEYQLV
jgi:DeoR family transcriptional regulator of aga operon